jgi:hypothetical protein
MGLEIALEEESGSRLDSVEDPDNLLHRILPSPEDGSFRCLNRVDWYGDTIFNRQQAADVLQEVRGIAKRVKGPDERHLLGRIAELALRCQNTPHLYLKFYGD